MLHSRLCARATIIALAVVILATPLAAQDPFPDFGKRFTQYSGNPLLKLENVNPWGLPKPEEPDTAIPGTIHPDVLYFPEGKDDYKFWMVFTPYEGWEPRECPEPPELCPCGGFLECPPWPWTSVLQYWERITLLRSNDGIDWKKDGISFNRNPVISPDPFRLGCSGKGHFHSDPDLVYAPNKGPNLEDWFLYFGDSCEEEVISLALSEDGIEYHVYPSRVIPAPGEEQTLRFAGPTVVYDPSTELFYAWYHYLQPPPEWDGGTIGFATSIDGIHWTPAATPACPGNPCWDNAVLNRDPRNFCEGGVTHPDVIKVGNEFWMYYQVQPDDIYHDLMIRRARSTDGVNWTKDEFPILSKYTPPPDPPRPECAAGPNPVPVVSSERRNISGMIRATSSGRPRWSVNGRATQGV